MNNRVEYLLKNINGAAHGLEVFAYSAEASMDGAYGKEDEAYTQRRIQDVLFMLDALAVFHADLKGALEVKS